MERQTGNICVAVSTQRQWNEPSALQWYSVYLNNDVYWYSTDFHASVAVCQFTEGNESDQRKVIRSDSVSRQCVWITWDSSVKLSVTASFRGKPNKSAKGKMN